MMMYKIFRLPLFVSKRFLLLFFFALLRLTAASSQGKRVGMCWTDPN